MMQARFKISDPRIQTANPKQFFGQNPRNKSVREHARDAGIYNTQSERKTSEKSAYL